MLLRHFRNPFLESPASSFGDFRIKRNKKIKKTPIHWADGNKQCIFSRFLHFITAFSMSATNSRTLTTTTASKKLFGKRVLLIL
jgi:hypothetical protein